MDIEANSINLYFGTKPSSLYDWGEINWDIGSCLPCALVHPIMALKVVMSFLAYFITLNALYKCKMFLKWG